MAVAMLRVASVLESDTRNPKITGHDRVWHSIALEGIQQQRKLGAWRADRIVLDGLQNHLPSDSSGTWVKIRYLIQGRWLERVEGARLAAQGMTVDAVEFSDDGRGFDFQKLGIDFSDKPENNGNSTHGPVGQFGEGLKRASAACILEGMPVEIFSRNWRATPRSAPLVVDGKQVHKLFFDIDIYDARSAIPGSRTVFHRPTKAFLMELSAVEKKVLPLRPGYRPRYTDAHGNAVVDGSGDLFVKGMFVTSQFKDKLLFGYDIHTDEIPRDRDHVKERTLGNIIGGLLADCTDIEIIKAFMQRALTRNAQDRSQQKPLLEIEYVANRWEGNFGHNRSPAHPELWQQAFLELFGPRAVLGTGTETEKLARLANYDVVRCANSSFQRFVERCQIPLDSKVTESMNAFLLADVPEVDGAQLHTLDTSITLSYRAQKWGMLRLILDAASNHLPHDSGGTSFKISLKVLRPGYMDVYDWVEWEPGKRYEKIEEIRIEDDGRGYHFTNLKYLASDKSGKAVGKKGEGLKLVSTAALRDAEHIKVKFRSNDWVAAPFASAPQKVGRRDEETLCFQVIEGIPEIQGSQTTIRGINDELHLILPRLDDYLLALRRDLKILHSTDGGRIFIEQPGRLMRTGAVFVKGVHITDHHAGRLLFSYDVNIDTDNISPERDSVDAKVLEGSVHDIIASCKNRDAIARIIKAAADNSGTEHLEFIDTRLEDDVAKIWNEVFHELYGRDAVLFSSPDMALAAGHSGFQVKRLNEKLGRTLHAAGVEFDREVVNEGLKATYVPLDRLTEQERQNLERLREVDAVLGLPPFPNIHVYESVSSRTGRDLTGRVGGFWNGIAISISRANLASWASAIRVYDHERGHKETAASDPTDPFRYFFEYYLAAMIGQELERKHDDPSYAIGVEAFSRWDVERIARLQEENHTLSAQAAAAQRGRAGAVQAMVLAKSELATLSDRMHQLQPGYRRDEAITFNFENRMVAVQPRSGRLDQGAFYDIKNALEKKRTLIERLIGFFGRPNNYEGQVHVFVSEANDRDVEMRLLCSREAMKVLRRVAHRTRPEHGTDTVTDAIDQAYNKLLELLRFQLSADLLLSSAADRLGTPP
ncbi:MAG: hypothetical protein WC690_03420 [bacterium]